MLDLYQIDKVTRLRMPGTRWASDVLAKLSQMGHEVIYLGPAPEVDDRDEAEKARRDALLDSTGL